MELGATTVHIVGTEFTPGHVNRIIID
jgi:hypothetical protein